MYDAIVGAHTSSLVPSKDGAVDYKERLDTIERRIKTIAKKAGVANADNLFIRVDGHPKAAGSALTEKGVGIIHVPMIWLMTEQEAEALQDPSKAQKAWNEVKEALPKERLLDRGALSPAEWKMLGDNLGTVVDKGTAAGRFEYTVLHELGHIHFNHTKTKRIFFFVTRGILLAETAAIVAGVMRLSVLAPHLKAISPQTLLLLVGAAGGGVIVVSLSVFTLWAFKRVRDHEREADQFANEHCETRMLEQSAEIWKAYEDKRSYPSWWRRPFTDHPPASERRAEMTAELERRNAKTML